MFKKMDLFTKTCMTIVGFLAENPSQRFYEKQIAKSCRISTGAVNNCMKLLKSFKIAEYEKRGKTALYRINLDNAMSRELRVLLTILDLSDLAEKIKPISKKIILFGSYSDGTYIEDSDIDLFIFSSGGRGKILSLIAEAEKKLGIKINPIIMDSSGIPALKEQPIYKNIMKGRVLWEKHEY